MTGKILERFESKFTKSDGCWEWQACINITGYGQFKLAGRRQRAHRVAYELYVGEIPSGMVVCHHCDNRKCVNPAHLFIGTQADNVRDCENKGRGVHGHGGKPSHTKLTKAQVIEILSKHSNGARNIDLAKEFDVSQSAISMIVCGRRWVSKQK